MSEPVTVSGRTGRWIVVSESPNRIRLRRLHESGLPAIRQALGIAKQCDLASVLKVSRSVISDIENGRRNSLPPHAADRLRTLLRESGNRRLLREVPK